MGNEVEVRRGDVFWLLSSFGDSCIEQAKRPIVIVSSDKGNESSPIVIGVPTTTKSKYGVIHPELTSIGKQSWVLCNQVSAFDKSRLGGYIGTLSDDEMEAVDRGLCVVMSLFPQNDEETEEQQREYEEEIDSLKKEVANLKNQLSQHKLQKSVNESLYERAIEEIVSLRLAADIERAMSGKVVVAEEKPSVEDIKVAEKAEGKAEINTCTETDLRNAGCTNTMVHNIIANRPYTSVEDIKVVPGITRIAYQVLESKLCCVPVPKQKREKPEPVVRKLNVNTATPTEMLEVLGINVTLGNHIRAYRNKHGKFEKVEDLLNVPRFGAGCMKKYGPMLEV